MESDHFTLKAGDGADLYVRCWAATPGAPKAVIQIVHGAAEHGARYRRFANFLNQAGYRVYAGDLRGHGHTRVRSGQPGDAGPDAWNHFVDDQKQLADLIHRENPGRKVMLFGHSLGSSITQDYMTRHGDSVDAYILSGTAWRPAPPKELLDAAEAAARAAPLGPSAIWASRFASFNAPFSGGKPGFEWLSRDAAEVRKYVDDPLCGFEFSNELTRDIFNGLAALREPAREARTVRDRPVLVIVGDQDPVGDNGNAVRALLDVYRKLGVTDVDSRFYPGARHEVLNETHRDDVQRDVLNWLDALV
jgi:alpha-beta hydrolase superfamily lysophospholipase